MNKRTEIRWLIFCGLFALVFSLAVRITLPGTHGDTDIQIHDTYFVLPSYYLFPFPMLAVFLFNLVFFSLTYLSGMNRSIRLVSIIATAFTGAAMSIAALLLSMEYFADNRGIPAAIVVLPVLLLVSIAFMAFVRMRTIIDTQPIS